MTQPSPSTASQKSRESAVLSRARLENSGFSHMSVEQFNASFPPPDFIQPAEFDRESTGYSVTDAASIIDSESGRTYQGYKEAKYFLPNDGLEQDRLDTQHEMFQLILDGKLWLAPLTLNPGMHILDVGTGTGIWATEFAQLHPTSHVIGTDLSRMQPEDLSHIPNVEFIVDDAEEDWLFPHVPGFDYVHLRAAFSCFSNPKKVMQNAFDNMKPGGWIEYQDLVPETYSDDGSHKGTAHETVPNLFQKGLRENGQDPFVTLRYKDMLREVGFEDIQEKRFIYPTNDWPDDLRLQRIGQYFLLQQYNGARGMCWKLFSAVGLAPSEIETIISDYRRDMKHTEIRAYHYFYVVYGRKPL